MDELFNIINDGKAHVSVEMDAEDLMAFSHTLRPLSTKNVNARAADFRVNFVHLGGNIAGYVTGERDKIGRKGAGLR